MDLVDITEWASEETKTIELTQVFLHAPFKLEVREFVPKEGDMHSELWQDGNMRHTHRIPPYAMVSLQKTTEMCRDFIDKNIATYIIGATNPLDDFPNLFSGIQAPAENKGELFRRIAEGFPAHTARQTSSEEKLTYNALRLWLVCRISSYTHKIIGSETLGGRRIANPASPRYNGIPMAPIMIAQKELVIYIEFLRPLSKTVLAELQELIYANE